MCVWQTTTHPPTTGPALVVRSIDSRMTGVAGDLGQWRLYYSTTQVRFWSYPYCHVLCSKQYVLVGDCRNSQGSPKRVSHTRSARSQVLGPRCSACKGLDSFPCPGRPPLSRAPGRLAWLAEQEAPGALARQMEYHSQARQGSSYCHNWCICVRAVRSHPAYPGSFLHEGRSKFRGRDGDSSC